MHIKLRSHFAILIILFVVYTFFYLLFAKGQFPSLVLFSPLKRADYTTNRRRQSPDGPSETQKGHDDPAVFGPNGDSSGGPAAENQREPNVACNIPRIDPFHNLALKEMRDVGRISCSKRRLASVSKGLLFLNASGIHYVHFQYIQRPKDNDLEYMLSDPVQLVEPTRVQAASGNVGCLVAQDNRVILFEGGEHISVSTRCTPEGFVDIGQDGSIRDLSGKYLTFKNCELQAKCSLEFTPAPPPMSFKFHSDGAITLSGTSNCLNLVTDVFGDYDELVVEADCKMGATKWTMHHFPERDVLVEPDLEEDFVKVVVIQQRKLHIEYHANVIPRPTEPEHPEDDGTLERKYNVALIMLESQSAANAQRKMPHTYEYLQATDNAFIFNNHAIVGDGTTDQLCAMLVGQLEQNLPSALKSLPSAVTVDTWPFIFTDFHNKNYATLFSEDDVRSPAFNYRLIGFKRPPADHYGRVFWLSSAAAAVGDGRCVGDSPLHKVNLDYTESFFDAYVKRPKLSVTILSAISHNSLNNIQFIDADLKAFVERMRTKGHMNDTFLFIVGDHGLRASAFRASFPGWLEERLPFFALVVPNSMAGEKSMTRSTIRQNTGTLTSHFDIYATLRHILELGKPNSNTVGKSLLSSIDRESRTCEHAGIGDHWCPCNNLKPLEYVSKKHIQLAEAVVRTINAIKNRASLGRAKCAELQLQQVKRVSYENVDQELVQTNFNETKYLVVFTVKPGGGIFEATVLHAYPGRVTVGPNISRLDLYGDQPKCILKQHPNLRKFCFCNEGVNR